MWISIHFDVDYWGGGGGGGGVRCIEISIYNE